MKHLSNKIKKLYIPILIFFVSCFFSANSYAQNFEISGIMQGEKPIAIINGKIKAIGDMVNNYKIIKITGGEVTFQNGTVIIKKKIRPDKGEATKQYQRKKKLENLPLFIGFEVDDLNKSNIFEILADDKCSVNIHKSGIVNQDVFSKVFISSTRYNKRIKFYLTNKSKLPIEFNFTADELYSLNVNKELKKIDLYSMGKRYPEVINPNETQVIYREHTDYFEYDYGRLESIVAFFYTFDYGKRKMLFKKCPSALF